MFLQVFIFISVITMYRSLPFRFFRFSFLPTTHMISVHLVLHVFYVTSRVQHTACNGLTAFAGAVFEGLKVVCVCLEHYSGAKYQ